MFGGITVFQFFVDDATRRVKVYPMKRKTEEEFLSTLKQYITEVGQPMAVLRSDGAAEFQTLECRRFYFMGYTFTLLVASSTKNWKTVVPPNICKALPSSPLMMPVVSVNTLTFGAAARVLESLGTADFLILAC